MSTFSSEIFIICVNTPVTVPDEIVSVLIDQAKKAAGPIPVSGTQNGKPFTQTVVKFAGVCRLYLNGIMRKSAGNGVGDIA